MRSVITGGAGFIGSHLAKRLAGEHGQVVVVDNLRRGCAEYVPDACQFIRADITDREAMSRAIEGADAVFHLAAQSNVMGAVNDPHHSLRSNVAGTLVVLEAARVAKVKKFIFASSREVYGEPAQLPVSETAPLQPKNAYGASKAAAEMYCRIFAGRGMDVAILRLTNTYGTHDKDRVLCRFIENALRGQPLTLYGGAQILDMVWAGTVVEAMVRAAALEAPFTTINIGSGRGVGIKELAQCVLQETKSESRIEEVPGRDAEVVRFVADISSATRMLDLAPPDGPLFGLADVVEWTRWQIRDEMSVGLSTGTVPAAKTSESRI